MAKPTAITAEQRAKVLELAEAGEGRNAIVKAVGISAGSVTKIVRDAGILFDRAAPKEATAARKADSRARRAELAGLLLEDAHRLRKQLWEPCIAFNFGGKDNTLAQTDLAEPIFADKLKLMQAAGSAIAKHIDLERHDAEQGAADARAMLTELGKALGVQKPDTQ